VSEERYSWDAGLVVRRKKFGRSFSIEGEEASAAPLMPSHQQAHIYSRLQTV
jgi:hypothetical protein